MIPLDGEPKNSGSRPTTTVLLSQASPGVSSVSGPSTPPKSSSSVSPSSPSSPPKSPYPIGYGEDDPRARLLGLAGYNEDLLAEITRRSIEKKIELLDAKDTRFFAFEGEVQDERTVADNRVQLEASKALDDILGVKAPPAKQTITVVHKVELPEWMLPDGHKPQVIEVNSTVEE